MNERTNERSIGLVQQATLASSANRAFSLGHNSVRHVFHRLVHFFFYFYYYFPLLSLPFLFFLGHKIQVPYAEQSQETR
jgi:hypothetical protein